MKWCFLVNDAPLLMEFLGKFAHQIIKEGEECIVVANSKIAEYTKKKYFPKNIRFFSKIDWCIKNYQRKQQEFGNLSWKEFFPDFDRYKLYGGYDSSLEIIRQLYQFFDFIFQEEKPDVVVHEPPANLFSEVAYHFCRKNNIIYLGLIGSRIDGRIDVFDLEHTCSKYEKDFKEIADRNISKNEKKITQDFIKKFISHQQLPAYLKDYIRSDLVASIKRYIQREKGRLQPWLRYFLNRKYFEPFDYESEIVLKVTFWNPLNALKRRLKSILYKNIFNSSINNDNFFLFPLQIQPEASTSVLATYFCDQLNTIKNIAFSLPLPYKLYVKEHPIAMGDRPIDFYRKLKQIPNVFLISPYDNTEDLIRKSQGVITLTSTLGMEAVLAGKPTYVLGNVFYSYHPLCKKINGFEELKQKIQIDLTKKSTINNFEDINLKFIISYFTNTITGDIVIASRDRDTNDYAHIYREIKRMFLE